MGYNGPVHVPLNSVLSVYFFHPKQYFPLTDSSSIPPNHPNSFRIPPNEHALLLFQCPSHNCSVLLNQALRFELTTYIYTFQPFRRSQRSYDNIRKSAINPGRAAGRYTRRPPSTPELPPAQKQPRTTPCRFEMAD